MSNGVMLWSRLMKFWIQFLIHLNILVVCLNLCKYEVPSIQCSCYLFLIQGGISGSYTWSWKADINMDWEKCVWSNFLSEATQVFGWVSVYSAGENSFFLCFIRRGGRVLNIYRLITSGYKHFGWGRLWKCC